MRYIMVAVIVGTAASVMGQAPMAGGLFTPPSFNATTGPIVPVGGSFPLATEQIGASSGVQTPPVNPISSMGSNMMTASGCADSSPAVAAPITEYANPGTVAFTQPQFSQPQFTQPQQTQPQANPLESALWGDYCGDTGFGFGNDVGGGWGRIDMLLWNLDGYATPALITSAPGSVVQNGSGALGGQGTRVLYGNRELGDDLMLGARWQFGRCLNACSGLGIQFDFLGLAADSQSSFAGNGSDIYARPFFNTDPQYNRPDGLVFAMPGIAEGNARFELSSDVVSVGPSLCFGGGCGRGGFLLGYRYFRLQESFEAQSYLAPDVQAVGAVTSLTVDDRIRTRNNFHGLEFGVTRGSQLGSLCWDVAALCALGEVERVVDLSGSATVRVAGNDDYTFPGGFYTGADGVGSFRDTDFAAIPQVRANVSYCMGRNWRLSAGYSFMYLSSAFRPGQFLNTTFNGLRLAQHPTVDTVTRPDVRRDDALLHGATAGLMYSF